MMAPTNTLPLPCLVFDYGGSEQPATTVYSVSDGTHRACHAEELRGKQSWPTSSGWVLVRDPATTSTFLWNPSPTTAGSDRVALPPMAEPPPSGSVCALSGSPVSGECTVVLSEPGESTALWYCHVASATSAWTRHEYDIGSVPAPRFLPGCPPSKRAFFRVAASGGRFYFHESTANLGIIDFPAPGGPPVYSLVPLTKEVPLRDPGRRSWVEADVYPLDIDGELHLVYVVSHGPDVTKVAYVGFYRMNSARNQFFRVDSIGDRAVLADDSLAGWCPATELGMVPNSVSWMSPRDKRLHVFDIGAGTKKVQEPCNGVAVPACLPFWMIPTHP